ncbi:aldehyde dehydrogenase, partial [Pseudomonas sp. HMWF031]
MKLSRLALDIVEPPIEVLNPFDGSVIGSVTNVCASQVPQLLETGRQGARACAALARHRRARIL